MRIGVLTFLRVGNFGANLQAFSTYCYLKNNGHEPVFLDYSSNITMFYTAISRWKRRINHQPQNVQTAKHIEFIDKSIAQQIPCLRSTKQVAKAVLDHQLDGMIIGSDAVAQHWPWLSTLKLGKRRPFWIEPLQKERRFPNAFWGIGFADKIPTAMMSVSSQNSKYHLFGKRTLNNMSRQLSQMKYISVRDVWTKDMMLTANSNLDISVTPDPVFALNQNAGTFLPTEEEIRDRFNLPPHYILIGLRSQVFTMNFLKELNEQMKNDDMECVAFCIDGVYNYQHPFAYQIPLPLSPLEWFALIKYASGYIGSNMHPIVSCLTNAVPCYSIDNWGSVNFWGKKLDSNSSKVYDVLKQYGLEENRCAVENGVCDISVKEICDAIRQFPKEDVRRISSLRVEAYNQMMNKIINCFKSFK
jgi:hypothetical protein